MKYRVFLFCVFVLLLTAAGTGLGDAAAQRQRCNVSCQRAKIIRHVFGPRYGRAAVRVAHCESGLDTGAKNGQFLGMFQMGAAERRRYGHGAGAWRQARAAHRYFRSSGRDWSPWACRP